MQKRLLRKRQSDGNSAGRTACGKQVSWQETNGVAGAFVGNGWIGRRACQEADGSKDDLREESTVGIR